MIEPDLYIPATTVADTVRLAVAPVFLLTGIGAFLNVCATRLSRIVDRSRENLVASDKGIALVRNLLRKSATDLTEKGTMPPGREREHMMVRSVSIVLEPDQNYAEACKNEMVADASRARVSV